MKIENKHLIEIVGVLAIVVSLLFVGMQLMLDRQVALGEQYFNRAESQKEDARTRFASESYMLRRAELWDNGDRPSWWADSDESRYSESGLTGLDMVQRIDNQYLRLLSFDNLYFQYGQGLLTEDFWLTTRIALKTTLRTPMGRGEFTRPGFGRPIDKLIEELIAEIDAE